MRRVAWKKRIRNACVAAGTYKDYFEIAIAELAIILERRDGASALYDQDPRPVIEFTNKTGATNVIKNPLLVLIDDLDKTALAYWRDLGLTPAGLRKINEKTFREKEEKANGLIDKLIEIRKVQGNG